MNMSFLNIMLCGYFSLEKFLQGVAKNTPTKFRNSDDIEAYASVLTHRRQSAKLIVTNCNDRFQL